MGDYNGIFLDDGVGESATLRYQHRRDVLRRQLTAPCLLFGVQEMPDTPYKTWGYCPVTVFQEPLFLFLTGINQPGLALWLDPEGEDVLFLPKVDAQLRFWEGPHFGLGDPEVEAEVRRLTGIKTLLPRKVLISFIAGSGDTRATPSKTLGSGDARASASESPVKNTQGRAQHAPTCFAYWHVDKKGNPIKDHNYQSWQATARTLRRRNCEIHWENVAPLQWHLRLPLDAVDQDNMRYANTLTGEAFLETVSALPRCTTETEVSGILNGAIQRRSWMGNSFPSIVAGGANATVLHYHKNNDALPKNGLLLLDFGLRWHGMHADISRTVPCSGRFNPLQKRVYEIVLRAQATVEAATKPGVTLAQLNSVCWDQIMADVAVMRADGATVRLDYDKAPHGVGHLLGRQVHDGDPHRNYRDMPLTPGLMITNEPGLYGQFTMTIDGVTYDEAIGVRIEDNLLITEAGVENMSQSIPKTITELETLFL